MSWQPWVSTSAVVRSNETTSVGFSVGAGDWSRTTTTSLSRSDITTATSTLTEPQSTNFLPASSTTMVSSLRTEKSTLLSSVSTTTTYDLAEDADSLSRLSTTSTTIETTTTSDLVSSTTYESDDPPNVSSTRSGLSSTSMTENITQTLATTPLPTTSTTTDVIVLTSTLSTTAISFIPSLTTNIVPSTSLLPTTTTSSTTSLTATTTSMTSVSSTSSYPSIVSNPSSDTISSSASISSITTTITDPDTSLTSGTFTVTTDSSMTSMTDTSSMSTTESISFTSTSADTTISSTSDTTTLTTTPTETTTDVTTTTTTTITTTAEVVLPTCNPANLQDGSFEEVDQAYLAKSNFQSGSWTFSGSLSSLQGNAQYGFPATNWGTLMNALIFQTPTLSPISTSQPLNDLTVGASYQVSYQLNPWQFAGTDLTCSFTTAYDGVVVDAQTLTAPNELQQLNDQYTQRIFRFVPLSPNGLLTFALACNHYHGEDDISGSPDGYNVWFNLDEIIIDPIDSPSICSAMPANTATTTTSVSTTTSTTTTTTEAALPTCKTENLLQDGSFEDIDPIYRGYTDFAAGGWTFSGRTATAQNNAQGYRQTVWGSMMATLLIRYGYVIEPGLNPAGISVSQQLDGLTAGAIYQLTYELSMYELDSDSGRLVCTVTSTYGGVLVDAQTFTESVSTQWIQRAATFEPATAGGSLSFVLTCSDAANSRYGTAWFNIDNVMLDLVDSQGLCTVPGPIPN